MEFVKCILLVSNLMLRNFPAFIRRPPVRPSVRPQIKGGTMDGGGGFVLWVAERFSAFAVMAAFCAFASLCCAILYQGREPRRVKLERMRARKNHVGSSRDGTNEKEY